MKYILRMVCLSVISMCLGTMASADLVYFKNGNKIEGGVERTTRGVWVEGVLFSEEEIDRIEKTSPPESEKKKWYQGWIDGVKLGGTDKNNESAAKAFSFTKDNPGREKRTDERNLDAPMGFNPLAGAVRSKANQADYLQEGLNAYKTHMNTQAMMIEYASDLQDQAYQKQLMMQEEIRRAEEGEYDEREAFKRGAAGNTHYKSSKTSSEPTYDDYDSYEDDYYEEREKRSSREDSGRKKEKSRLGASIKIGPDGETTWE